MFLRSVVSGSLAVRRLFHSQGHSAFVAEALAMLARVCCGLAMALRWLGRHWAALRVLRLAEPRGRARPMCPVHPLFCAA